MPRPDRRRDAGQGRATSAGEINGVHIMSLSSIIGVVAAAVGIALLFFAWRASNAPVDQVSEALTGRFTGNTMWYLIGGVIGVVAGGALLLRGFAAV